MDELLIDFVSQSLTKPKQTPEILYELHFQQNH